MSDPARKSPGKGLGKRLLLVGVLLAVAFALYRSGLLAELDLESLKARQAELSGWVEANFLLALGAYFLLYVAVTALSLPGAAILTLGAGAVFGLLWGTVLVSFASTIGATAAFLVARFLLRDTLSSRFGERMKRFDEGVRRDGAFFLFTLRLVPVFPFFIVNILAGLSALRVGTFYWVSQLGMLPATIAYVYAGTQLAELESAKDVLSPGLIGAFVVIGLLPLLLRGLTRWLQARRVYKGHRKPARFDYNLIAIGAGSAGLVTSYIGAAVKAKVALIEKHRMGGDCLNTGCVPSKALIRTARLLAEARDSQRYGIDRMQAEFDFATVMERVQTVIGKVEPHDSVERYTGLGVDVIKGEARLVSPWEVEVEGRRISARSIVIATGGRPALPDLPGLEEVPYLTSDTIWSLRERPARLLVLGGGPIGCELAQCFARLGSAVTVVSRGERLLPKEDADAGEHLAQRLRDEGLTLALRHSALRIERRGEGHALVCEIDGRETEFGFDRLLLAVGRRANVEGFGLQELGVRLARGGTIEHDALMRTNFPNIHVCGDVAGPYQFTHVSSHQAWYAAVNGLLAPFWSFRADYRVIPWVTFTDPEVARVGLSEDEARERGIEVEVTRYGLDDLDRAIADSADEGFVKVLTPPGKDEILGVSIVGQHAGELLPEFVLAMKYRLGLNKLLGTIHVYPTWSEANKYAAGVWKKANAPQGALRWAERFFAWRRG
ncbi:FAD-dependent oxidoreductase [Pseudomarimonas salicorniae]|uniref:FAD-dependent oxidoreductase n=1 Tax=Pseudomarimonas salicorniae TaxID=2933270 RepID=A0ABT0GLK1_9GAMM|nr:bifunctional TVP38/TMEM64 family protein/FAD-dependent oxidoreductase [Lysobacter sp. CAU 1642]MCK7595109.1 FAD-dependent oxidoreductase [Lysobacter sp. CAU 1642]